VEKEKYSHVKASNRQIFIWDSGRIEYFILIENNFRTILYSITPLVELVSIVNFASILSVPNSNLRLN
jgi:hypothetical protein